MEYEGKKVVFFNPQAESRGKNIKKSNFVRILTLELFGVGLLIINRDQAKKIYNIKVMSLEEE